MGFQKFLHLLAFDPAEEIEQIKLAESIDQPQSLCIISSVGYIPVIPMAIINHSDKPAMIQGGNAHDVIFAQALLKHAVKTAVSLISEGAGFLSERIAVNGLPGREVCIIIFSLSFAFRVFRRDSFCSALFPPMTSFPVEV